MQLSIVEFARHVVVGFHDAHSIELDPQTTHPVIHLMPEQDGIEDIGGTLRLGSYPCVLDKNSKAYELYGEETIHERHRHRYEVNNYYREDLEKAGLLLSGLSPDGRIVEMCEIPTHPWFIATGLILNLSQDQTDLILYSKVLSVRHLNISQTTTNTEYYIEMKCLPLLETGTSANVLYNTSVYYL